MTGDFIEESEFNTEPPEITTKHRFLFRMSNLAQRRGLMALRDSLVSILPLAVISTILYIVVAVIDLITKPDLIRTISSTAGDGSGLELNPENILQMQYISPFLIFCALIPVFFAVVLTFEFSRKYRSGDALPLSVISGAITFISLYSPLFAKNEEDTSIMEFPLNLMEGHPQFLSGGIFVALLVSLLNYCMYRLFVKRGLASPLPVNVNDALQGGFRVVVPGAFTTLLILALVFLVHEPFGTVIYYSTTLLTKGLSGIYGLIIIVILVQLFAFFGIQGASSVYSVFWVLLLSGSIDPPLWGDEAVDSGFATLSAIFFFILIGGTGGTLSLNLAMLRARSSQIRKLGNMTFIPSIMNANDLIIFGLPLAFNRHLIIPFFLVPLVNLGIAYTAFAFDLIRAPALFLPPYIPAPLGAYAACGGDWVAIVISLVCILIGWAIYSYFLQSYDLKVAEWEEIPDDEVRPRRTVI